MLGAVHIFRQPGEGGGSGKPYADHCRRGEFQEPLILSDIIWKQPLNNIRGNARNRNERGRRVKNPPVVSRILFSFCDF